MPERAIHNSGERRSAAFQQVNRAASCLNWTVRPKNRTADKIPTRRNQIPTRKFLVLYRQLFLYEKYVTSGGSACGGPIPPGALCACKLDAC